jgi:hypothetical protein
MAKESISDSNSILKTILIIVIVAGIAYLIYYLYNQQYTSGNQRKVVSHNSERVSQENIPENHFANQNTEIEYDGSMQGDLQGMNNPILKKENFNPSGSVVGEDNMEHFSNNRVVEEERKRTSFPNDQLTAEELLPQDNSSLWAQVNPSGEGNLKDRNFLQSGYHIGINTVGQTLRNANLQLRSEPPCPQVVVSPFIQSTITPDVSRKPFEIGGCGY